MTSKVNATVSPSNENIEQTIIPACRELADLALGGLDEKAGHVQMIAIRWARAGVPLETIYEQLREGVKRAVTAGARGVDAGRPDPTVLLDGLAAVMGAVSTVYFDELRGQQQSMRQRLISALLNGEEPAKLARECGVRIARNYSVIAIAFTAADPHPVSMTFATTQIRVELSHRYGSSALARLSSEGGTILVPASRDDSTIDHLLVLQHHFVMLLGSMWFRAG